MIDKQKQIEEMAKTVCECCIENEEFTCGFVSQPCIFAKTFAETSYNKGYRKIPEGAVVLTREEHIQMLKDLANSNEIAYLSGYGKGSTETAEKFAERLKVRAIENGQKNPLMGIRVTERDIDEICKEITEEKNE